MRLNSAIVKKGLAYLSENGLVHTYQKVKHYIRFSRVNLREINQDYKKWIKHVEKIDEKKIKKELESFVYKPLMSICIPVYNVEEKWLRRCIDSIQNQYYTNWQICMADDCSTDKKVQKILKEYEKNNSKIDVVYRSQNGHISKATNSALGIARGEFIVLMDNDDELAPHALFEVVKLLQMHKDADVIYSDEDKMTENGERMEPYFKPDYCPDTLLSYNYISHLGVYRKNLVDAIGGFRVGLEGAQDYNLVLRMTEVTDKIYHIPQVLYHWRAISGSTALGGGQKNYAYIAGKKALEDAMRRRGCKAEVQFLEKILFYNVRMYPCKKHFITIIISFKGSINNLKKCLKSIYKKTKIQDFEIIIVDYHRDNKVPHHILNKYRIKNNVSIIRKEKNANYSQMGKIAVNKSRGDLLVFIDENIEILSDNWLILMAAEAERKEIGAVGVKMVLSDHSVYQAGVVLGMNGLAGKIGYGANEEDSGYMSYLAVRRNYSVVSRECFMVQKEKFLQTGGFDTGLQNKYQVLDLCLKMRESNYYNIVLCDILMKYNRPVCSEEQQSASCMKDEMKIRERWKQVLMGDPCFSPNFSLDSTKLRIKTYL